MKTKYILSILAALLFSTSALFAKPLAGPKGGRILTETAPHAEFFIDAGRNIVISFYDADLKQIAPADQVATATVEAPSGKMKLEFVIKNGSLASTAPLPAGDGYRVVVQLKTSAASA